MFIASSILLALASAACAQTTGFDIAWQDCTGQPRAAQNLVYACNGSRDGNPFRLVFSFIPPDLPNFVALQAILDIRTSEGVLPDWWRMGTGECRDGAIVFPASMSGIGTGTTGACPSPWGGIHDHGGGYQWLSESTIYESVFIASGRLMLTFARATTTVLEAGQRYLGGVITLDPAIPPLPAIDAPPVLAARHGTQAAPQGESAPAPADLPCAGCGLPACIVLNQVELLQEVGSPGGDIIVLKFPIDHGFVTWQGGDIGGQGCPLSLPVKRATWGAIKAIYR